MKNVPTQRGGGADVGDDGTVVTWAWPFYARFVALLLVVIMIPNKLSNGFFKLTKTFAV